MKYGDAIYRNMKTKRVYDEHMDLKYIKWSNGKPSMPAEKIVRNIFFISLALLIIINMVV